MIEHISVRWSNLNVYLLRFIVIAHHKHESKISVTDVFAHCDLQFFRIIAFNDEVDQFLIAYNLAEPLQVGVLVFHYQAIVGIINFILVGKLTVISIHPYQVPIGGCKTNGCSITIPVQSKFGIGRPEVVDKYIIVAPIQN